MPKAIAESEEVLVRSLEPLRRKRILSQRLAFLSFIPFIGFLIWHGADHAIPLFWSSAAGFGGAFLAVSRYSRMRRFILRDAWQECKEYLFLIPLFLAITLLKQSGFFESLHAGLQTALQVVGPSHVAYGQFWLTTVLSALLDNNVVADFASHALHGFDLAILNLFAMAQIAGYALGGCWTHVGSAQSVVAFAFIQKRIDGEFTPTQWVRSVTRIVLQIAAVVTVFIYLFAWFLPQS